jgi:hypothetical protein
LTYLLGVKNALKAGRLHPFDGSPPPFDLGSPMPRFHARLCLVVLIPIAVACQRASNQHGVDQNAGAADTSSAAALLSPPVMVASKPDSQIKRTVAEVTNDVIALRSATPAAAIGQLPAHARLVNEMLTNFETRIRAMHVDADPAWTSVIDSVRTDLARLPALTSDSLAAFLPRHLNRVMRIVACIQMVKG